MLPFFFNHSGTFHTQINSVSAYYVTIIVCFYCFDSGAVNRVIIIWINPSTVDGVLIPALNCTSVTFSIEV